MDNLAIKTNYFAYLENGLKTNDDTLENSNTSFEEAASNKSNE